MIDEALSKLTEEQIREFAFLYMWLRDGGTSRKGLRKCYRPMDAHTSWTQNDLNFMPYMTVQVKH